MDLLDSFNLNVCQICHGEAWVCENHPSNKWNFGKQSCCDGAGQLCECSKNKKILDDHHLEMNLDVS